MKVFVSVLRFDAMSCRVRSCLDFNKHAAVELLKVDFQLTWAAALPCTGISARIHGRTGTVVPRRTSVCGSDSCCRPIR